MSDLHSQTLAPTALLVASSKDRRHACWHGATMWWMVLASSWNKVSSYLWASVFFHAQQCWSVPVTSQANPRVGLLGLPRLAGGIPTAAGRHWGCRCCNLQKALQPDLFCRVMCSRGYIFTLFTKNQFTLTLVPLQVNSVATLDLILFLGGRGVPKHLCVVITLFTFAMPGPSK